MDTSEDGSVERHGCEAVEPEVADGFSSEQLAESKAYARRDLECTLADMGIDLAYLGLMAFLGATFVDRWLRWIVVTPDMHRVHHSVRVDESNTNFGFNLPWWDRLFGTYRAQPRGGHEGMSIGVEHLQGSSSAGIAALVAMPFVTEPGRYPISNRRTVPERTALPLGIAETRNP